MSKTIHITEKLNQHWGSWEYDLTIFIFKLKILWDILLPRNFLHKFFKMPKLSSFKPPTKRSRDDSDSEDHGQAKSSVKKSAKTEPVKNPVIKSEMPDGIEQAFHSDPDLDAGSISAENLPSPVKKSAKVKTEPAKSPVKKSAKAKPAKITVKKSAKDEPKTKPAKAGGSTDASNDGSGDPSWSLGNMRWAKVSSIVLLLYQI